jgi:translocator protein
VTFIVPLQSLVKPVGADSWRWHTPDMPSSSRARAAALAGSLGAVTGVAGVGTILTGHSRRWYSRLDRPAWSAPESVLGPVWSLLLASQAVSAWLVWRADDDRDSVDVPALASYSTQLALNLAWSLLFFGLRRPGLALVDICVLWLAVLVTVREFGRRHRFAAALLLPYLGWIGYAAALNTAIWLRNR